MGNANSTKLQQERLPLLPRKEQLPPPPPPPPQPESDDHFTCEICGEHMLSSNKFRNDDLCVHQFCVCCITDYVQFRIEKDGVAEIECPGLNCDQFLDPIFCRDRELITPTLFDKWCDLLCQRSVSELDHCYCPNPQCSAVVLNECGGVVKRSVCPNCKELFCFLCKLPWHAGFRCKEQRYGDDVSLFLNWDQNDVASGDLAKRYKWMRCPQCRHCVEVDRHNCHRAKCRCGCSFHFKCGRKEHQCDCCRYCGERKEHNQCDCCRYCRGSCLKCGWKKHQCVCCKYCRRRCSHTAAIKL